MRCKSIFGPVRIVAILSMLIVGLLPLSLASAQGPTIVSISTPGQVNLGEQFTVDILVEPETAIAGVQFELAFDPSVVTVDSVAEGNLLSQGGATTYFNPGSIDNTAGTISGVAGAITAPGQTVSTAGTFAIITLTVGTQGGTSALILSGVVVGDINGQSVLVSVVSGQVTINQPPRGGGGGGGGADRMSPRFYDVLASTITKTSADISWQTSERSTSQVEYWASPSKLSPLDETKVINHIAHLTDLIPATTYSFRVMSQDKAGNLAVSDTNTFTTLGRPANFAVSELEITPNEVNVDQETSISVLVTNLGDATGDYELTLRVDGVELAREVIPGLAGGASQVVTFNTVIDTAGVFDIDVNGVKSTIVVNKVPVSRISVFGVTPIYDAKTHRIAHARVFYQIENLSKPMIDTELILQVYLDGEPLQEVLLISTSTLTTGTTDGSHDYVPAQGWRSGTYTFQTELYEGGKPYQRTVEERLEVSPEASTPVVSWKILGAIILATLLIRFVTVFSIVRHRWFRLCA
jgi:hypothetical protein